MLLLLRDYMSKQGVVSTQQLSREFHLDYSALQPMLEFWLKKGVIHPCQEQASCQSTCFKCRTKVEYYQYGS